MSIASILSTKKLTIPQQEQLSEAAIAFEHIDFIQTIPLDFKGPSAIENAIFTSRNAIRAVLEKKPKITAAYCIGEKSAALLTQAGYKVVHTAENAVALADYLEKNAREKTFVFFSGNLRLDTLPGRLSHAGIRFEEICVYRTEATPQKMVPVYDGILFFSPSGVRSFLSLNAVLDAPAFCIGATTATAAKKAGMSVIIAEKPAVEKVLESTINYFRKI